MDVHEATATVKEALVFSAVLRQPREIPYKEKIAYVDHIIELLELEDICDALIGSKCPRPIILMQTSTDRNQLLVLALASNSASVLLSVSNWLRSRLCSSSMSLRQVSTASPLTTLSVSCDVSSMVAKLSCAQSTSLLPFSLMLSTHCCSWPRVDEWPILARVSLVLQMHLHMLTTSSRPILQDSSRLL